MIGSENENECGIILNSVKTVFDCIGDKLIVYSNVFKVVPFQFNQLIKLDESDQSIRMGMVK
jgi:hypothetical protein